MVRTAIDIARDVVTNSAKGFNPVTTPREVLVLAKEVVRLTDGENLKPQQEKEEDDGN